MERFGLAWSNAHPSPGTAESGENATESAESLSVCTKNIDGSEALSPAPERCGWLTRAPPLGSCSVMKMVEENSLGAFLKSTFLPAYTLCVLSCPKGLHLYSFPPSQELQMQELYTLDLIYGKQKTKAGLLIVDTLWLCHKVRYVLHSRVIAFRTLKAYLS